MPIFVGDTTNGRQAAVLQSTGSTWFGNSSDDLHNIYRLMYVTGTLHINGDVSSDYVTVIDNDEGSTGHGLKVTSDGSGSGTNIFDAESGSTTLFRIRGDGRVGIGKVTSLPAAQLTVSSSNSDSDIAIAHKIHHIGDSDTFIQFDDDELNIEVGGRQMIKLSESSTDKITFNNGANDIDLQIKGSSNANLIRTDAANHRVGINTSAPGKPLEINGSNSDGGSIRLTYNDSDGSATDYADISVGANGALTFQAVDSDGTSGHIDFEADGDIVLDIGSSKTLEIKENSTSLLLITPSSSHIDFQPQVADKDIRFASQSGNRLMTLDSSDDAVKIDRRLGLGYDSIMSSATLNANTPIVMVIAGMSDVTGTLADPSFAGQIKIVIGLNAGVGNSIVSYKNGAGSTTTKTLDNVFGAKNALFWAEYR